MYSNQFLTSVDLYRDGIDCPWGFRLKGGIDVDGGTPLEIIRVSLSIFVMIWVWKWNTKVTVTIFLAIYDLIKI